MRRYHQILFVVSLIAFCWLAMMAVHELGHVMGAWVTGGTVTRVVLHPLTISRTDVMPNPQPGVVVWMGPIVGCLLPLAIALCIPRRHAVLRSTAWFFAGFCLLANGTYIAFGSFDRVGDCGEMWRTGTPTWVMLTFGAITIPTGLLVWHWLGSPREFLADPHLVTPRMAYVMFGLLVTAITLGALISPR